MENSGKVVWITGASSGIGEALAHAYAAKGARLILSSRNEAGLQKVRDACSRSSEHAVLPLDLQDPGSLDARCREALGLAGRIDVLVNNGGVSQRGLACETTLDVDRRIMETNFFGTVALTKAVLPSMIERSSGCIIVVSSLMGKFGTPLRSSYSASKHALHGFFDSLRAEVWNKGITVTIICPGFIRTNISINALTRDGSPHGAMDDAQAHGMPSHVCAEKIIDAAHRGKHEVCIGGKELMGIYLKRFFPGMFNRIIRRVKVT